MAVIFTNCINRLKIIFAMQLDFRLKLLHQPAKFLPAQLNYQPFLQVLLPPVLRLVQRLERFPAQLTRFQVCTLYTIP